ncbi:UNKNOWN [Stylonychia lemnae]|uniref:Uncharacterized protein n=1 Tax=Stylonychia lemnae TaxID=5949 RepID=A0A078B9Y9_STYLE|nr:UNKNOWN [Stylonychia lemnae]|eukprot:CDW90082.1 UNKNOWN [Stylonychia lemnae]
MEEFTNTSLKNVEITQQFLNLPAEYYLNPITVNFSFPIADVVVQSAKSSIFNSPRLSQAVSMRGHRNDSNSEIDRRRELDNMKQLSEILEMPKIEDKQEEEKIEDFKDEIQITQDQLINSQINQDNEEINKLIEQKYQERLIKAQKQLEMDKMRAQLIENRTKKDQTIVVQDKAQHNESQQSKEPVSKQVHALSRKVSVKQEKQENDQISQIIEDQKLNLKAEQVIEEVSPNQVQMNTIVQKEELKQQTQISVQSNQRSAVQLQKFADEEKKLIEKLEEKIMQKDSIDKKTENQRMENEFKSLSNHHLQNVQIIVGQEDQSILPQLNSSMNESGDQENNLQQLQTTRHFIQNQGTNLAIVQKEQESSQDIEENLVTQQQQLQIINTKDVKSIKGQAENIQNQRLVDNQEIFEADRQAFQQQKRSPNLLNKTFKESTLPQQLQKGNTTTTQFGTNESLISKRSSMKIQQQSDLQSSQMSELSKKLQELFDENENLRFENESLKQDIEAIKLDLQGSQMDSDQLRQELMIIQHSQKKKKDNDKGSVERSGLPSSVERLTDEHALYIKEKELQNMHQKLNILRKENENLKKNNISFGGAFPSISDLHSEVASKNREILELKQTNAKLERLIHKINNNQNHSGLISQEQIMQQTIENLSGQLRESKEQNQVLLTRILKLEKGREKLMKKLQNYDEKKNGVTSILNANRANNHNENEMILRLELSNVLNEKEKIAKQKDEMLIRHRKDQIYTDKKVKSMESQLDEQKQEIASLRKTRFKFKCRSELKQSSQPEFEFLKNLRKPFSSRERQRYTYYQLYQFEIVSKSRLNAERRGLMSTKNVLNQGKNSTLSTVRNGIQTAVSKNESLPQLSNLDMRDEDSISSSNRIHLNADKSHSDLANDHQQDGDVLH